jgi:hypothetical protein
MLPSSALFTIDSLPFVMFLAQALGTLKLVFFHSVIDKEGFIIFILFIYSIVVL